MRNSPSRINNLTVLGNNLLFTATNGVDADEFSTDTELFAVSMNQAKFKIRRALRRAVRHDAAMNFNKNIGMLLLAVFLIGYGILGMTGLGTGYLLPILALVAGIFILIGK